MTKYLHKTSKYDLVRIPLSTEKANDHTDKYNKFSFYTDLSATKASVKSAVEFMFNVKVSKVNLLNLKPKTKTFKGVKGIRSKRKKAIVTLQQGHTINYDNMEIA